MRSSTASHVMKLKRGMMQEQSRMQTHIGSLHCVGGSTAWVSRTPKSNDGRDGSVDVPATGRWDWPLSVRSSSRPIHLFQQCRMTL